METQCQKVDQSDTMCLPLIDLIFAQLAGFIEYTDCIPREG